MIEMVKNFGDRVWRAIKKPELVFAIILLSVFSALSIGHEGLRLVKLLVLYLPFCFLIFLFAKNGNPSWIGKTFVLLVPLAFYVDVISRYYLRQAYHTARNLARVF